MPDVLNQEEVDALLRGLSGGAIDTETDAGFSPDGINSFDFTNQDRIIRGRMPTLEMVHDRFARLFRNSLSNSLRRVVDVTVLSSDLVKYGEFMRGIPLPTSLQLFKMEPLKGNALVVLEGKLVFAVVDSYFGGKGVGHVKLEGRDFTLIEQRLIKKVVDLALADYEQAWSAIQPTSIQHVRSEINPQFVSMVTPSDVVVTIQLELEFEETSGLLTFCLPYSLLEPIKDVLRAGFQSDTVDSDATWTKRMREQIREANVDISVIMGHTKITGRELLALRKGSVLMLREDHTHPVDIFVEDVLKFRGRIGVHRGNRAVQIEDVIHIKR